MKEKQIRTYGIKNIMDIIFPPRCVMCDKVIPPGRNLICAECEGELKYVSEPRCFRCGKEIASEEDEYCPDCEKRSRSFIRGFPVFNYVPPVSDSLMALKYRGRQEYAVYFGRVIAEQYGEEFRRLGIDALVSVPIYKKKYVTRGYNQAALIAMELGKCTGIHFYDKLLVRVEETPPQKELSDEEREKNMEGAFAIDKKADDIPKAVMLVDDIYTTGATVEACTRVLLKAGVERVYYTSVAIGVGS
ncbi:MAG: ComF family protein [Eubacterium sp.]|nr:ComF family protein [Eubacterium sp.]